MKKTVTETRVEVLADTVKLGGVLCLPPEPRGMILFAHAGEVYPRNQLLSKCLTDEGFGTLLFDLLTEEEMEEDMMMRELRFNIPFLSYRLTHATHWLEEQYQLEMGFLGDSTGAAAAIIAAAELGPKISAVVSRGGRPDLAGQSLTRIQAPTLLIVGGADHGVIELNQRALEMMQCEKKLEVIPEATHLFEEQGALEKVGHLTAQWFSAHL